MIMKPDRPQDCLVIANYGGIVDVSGSTISLAATPPSAASSGSGSDSCGDGDRAPPAGHNADGPDGGPSAPDGPDDCQGCVKLAKALWYVMEAKMIEHAELWTQIGEPAHASGSKPWIGEPMAGNLAHRSQAFKPLPQCLTWWLWS